MTAPPIGPPLLSFAEARTLVDRMVQPPDIVTEPTGYETASVYRVVLTAPERLAWDLPCVIVEKATGHVSVLPWTEYIHGEFSPEKMRPVS